MSERRSPHRAHAQKILAQVENQTGGTMAITAVTQIVIAHAILAMADEVTAAIEELREEVKKIAQT